MTGHLLELRISAHEMSVDDNDIRTEDFNRLWTIARTVTVPFQPFPGMCLRGIGVRDWCTFQHVAFDVERQRWVASVVDLVEDEAPYVFFPAIGTTRGKLEEEYPGWVVMRSPDDDDDD